jgi:hypothetical protein
MAFLSFPSSCPGGRPTRGSKVRDSEQEQIRHQAEALDTTAYMLYPQYMGYTDDAERTLVDAGRRLKHLLAQAVETGDFAAVAKVARLAERFEEFLNMSTTKEESGDAPSGPVPSDPPAAGLGISVPMSTTPDVVETVTSKGTGTKGHYPRFVVEGDTLVKIGWSRSSKSEYQHKAPRAVVGLVVARFMKAGGGKRRVTVDQVLKTSASDGTPLPDYQVYLCLAWLRAIGAVAQHGRKGYTANSGDLVGLVDSEWKKLAHV